MRILGLLTILTGSLLLCLPTAQAQTTSSPTSSDAAISGSNWEQSEVVSKASEMPTFPGFGSLDQSNFVGRAASNSSFIGRGDSASPLRSSSGSTRRTSSTASRSTSRTTSRGTSTANRNRTMTGNRGGTGTGANSNNISSLTTLGSDLEPSGAAQVSSTRFRATKIENGINNYGKIKTVLPVTVEVDDSATALVRGAVQTQQDRRLVENYVKLHGVKAVKNELVCTENRP